MFSEGAHSSALLESLCQDAGEEILSRLNIRLWRISAVSVLCRGSLDQLFIFQRLFEGMGEFAQQLYMHLVDLENVFKGGFKTTE